MKPNGRFVVTFVAANEAQLREMKVLYHIYICWSALLLVTIALAIGCSPAPPTPPKAPSGRAPVAASPATPDVPPLKESEPDAPALPPNRQGAQTTALAADIPVYPGARKTAGNAAGIQTIIYWQTPDPKEKVLEYYERQLPEMGWEITQKASYGKIEATKEGRKLTVGASSGTNSPTEILVVEIGRP